VETSDRARNVEIVTEMSIVQATLIAEQSRGNSKEDMSKISEIIKSRFIKNQLTGKNILEDYLSNLVSS
jgi:hypothetical protein